MICDERILESVQELINGKSEITWNISREVYASLKILISHRLITDSVNDGINQLIFDLIVMWNAGYESGKIDQELERIRIRIKFEKRSL